MPGSAWAVAPWVSLLNVIRSTAAPDKATTMRHTTTVNTATTMVPAEAHGAGLLPQTAPRSPRRSLTWVALVVLLALGAATVTVPYYAIAPGSAVSLSGLVKVVGAPTFAPERSISLTTVSLRPVTVVGAVQGWLDPSVDVVGRDRVLPPNIDGEKLKAFNLQEMDGSKNQAIGVALEKLGYDAITGRGAEVVQLAPGAPAAGALAPGDVIVGLDGEPISTHHDLIRLLRTRVPGGSADIVVQPGGSGGDRTVAVALGANPAAPDRAFLGATLRTRDFRLDLPFEVDLSSERIGGPSAGLAFTLGLLDVLTPGELTGGRPVAATGTIELDGSVGEVGGVAQKTAAIKQAGIEVFLVPRGELAEATRLAGGDLAVEPVDTLDEALAALARSGGDALRREPA